MTCRERYTKEVLVVFVTFLALLNPRDLVVTL